MGCNYFLYLFMSILNVIRDHLYQVGPFLYQFEELSIYNNINFWCNFLKSFSSFFETRFQLSNILQISLLKFGGGDRALCGTRSKRSSPRILPCSLARAGSRGASTSSKLPKDADKTIYVLIKMMK